MKKIILIVLIYSSIYAMPIDKIYMFGLYNQDEKENKSSLFKLSVEKTLDVNDNGFAFIEAIGSLDYDKDEKETSDGIVREVYYDQYFLHYLFNIRIGRSIKTFNFTNTYNVLNFLSFSGNMEDINDRVLDNKPLDGVSFVINDITNEETSQYVAIHAYVDDISDKDKSENQKYLLEMSTSEDKESKSIFIFNNNQGHPAIAAAISKTISDKINFNSTIRYDFTSDGEISSVSGGEYNVNEKLLLGLEGITLTKNIEGRFDRAKKHAEFESRDDFINYYKNLTSQKYISMYSRYKWDDTSLTFSWLKNLNDSSRRFSTQINHQFETIEIDLQANHFQGRENTEFGYIGEQKAYEIKFFMSYLWMN